MRLSHADVIRGASFILVMFKLESEVNFCSSDVKFNGNAINVKKLWKTISDLRKALRGSDTSLDPMELNKDLQDQIGKATTISAEITFTPVYSDSVDVIGVAANCGKGNSGTEPESTPPPPS